MRFLYIILCSVFFVSSAYAADIPFEEFPNHVMTCTHEIQDETGMTFKETKISKFEYGGDAYFNYSNLRARNAVGRMYSHVSFVFYGRENAYKYYFATSSYDNADVKIESSEETIQFTGNKDIKMVFESEKLQRKFFVTCSIAKPE